ncbi:hypothetical protein [Sciscionella marina]|uniref:hypothetical protein n=1 Tax=Sciscionella marina TaxID=508770 RepID=UPI00146B4A15|nr:hypothetical protein [Sciscionella marina]
MDTVISSACSATERESITTDVSATAYRGVALTDRAFAGSAVLPGSRIRRFLILPFADILHPGVGLICGEWGGFSHRGELGSWDEPAPSAVALVWGQVRGRAPIDRYGKEFPVRDPADDGRVLVTQIALANLDAQSMVVVLL